MSTYYEFYLAQKKDNKFSIIGPYEFDLESKEFKLKTLYTTSRAFIDWDGFLNFMEPLPIKSMDPDQIKIMCSNSSWLAQESKLKSCSYVCSLTEMYQNAKQRGLRQGYILLDSFNYLKECNYLIETAYELREFLLPEQVAEMDNETRKNYGKVAFMETYSVDYVADSIATAAAGIIGYEREEGYYIICVVDY